MRRAPIILTATVLGTAGVLLFKPLSTTAVESPPATAASTGSSSSGSISTSSGSTPSSTSTPSASSSGSGSKSSASSARKAGTYTGAGETTRFGTTQVKVTLKNGRISAVTTVQLNQNDPRSVQISANAAPILRSEVLAKQTAAVDTVSGATYTSAAYKASLQSALDKAGYKAADGSKASLDLSNVEG